MRPTSTVFQKDRQTITLDHRRPKCTNEYLLGSSRLASVGTNMNFRKEPTSKPMQGSTTAINAYAAAKANVSHRHGPSFIRRGLNDLPVTVTKLRPDSAQFCTTTQRAVM